MREAAARSRFRAGTRPSERKAKAISGAKDDELALLFPGQADGEGNRCADCNRTVTKQATRCLKCAAKKRLADGKYTNSPEINPVAPRAQKGDRAPLREGDVYMVWLKDEGRAMMAQVFSDKGVVRLQPINHTLPPVFKKPRDIEIRGRVLLTIHCEYPAYC